MIQDISPNVFYNDFEIRTPSEGDVYIVVKDNKVLMDETHTRLPNVADCGVLESTYLFRIDDVGFFMCDCNIEGYEYQPVRQVRFMAGQDWLRFGIVTAVNLVNWYHDNQYCGRCGHKMIKDSKERMLKCDCGNMVYPKICPVAIVGIIKDDTILLTKYADKGRFARYALVAGFCEFGESIEDTLKREVHEEVGSKIKNIRYFGSQPWPFSSSLIFGFYCELDGDDQISFNDHELGEAIWATQDQIPIENEQVSITYELMKNFKLKGRDVLK